MKNTKLSSPWIEQIKTQRTPVRFENNHHTQVAVIGAGIAGVTTAYFLLKNTRKRIALIEANRVAHGATGHNAGQLVSYFERPFLDIVGEFGLEMAAEGQRAIESSWDLIEDIRNDLDLETPCHIFKGYAGCVDIDELLIHLRGHKRRKQANLPVGEIYISETFSGINEIPKSLKSFYKIIPHETILDLLQTKDRHYIAALAGKKGCMNSALFCEEIITKLKKRYPYRFTLTEHTPVSLIKLYKNHAELETTTGISIRAKRMILCTNGFEKFHIENHAGANIDVKFHHLVRGSVGYMAAFTEEPQMTPTAISYLPTHLDETSGAYDADPYFYLTRRPNDAVTKIPVLNNLVCIGGPEALMDDTNGYGKEHPYPNEAKAMIDKFIQHTYRHAGKKLKYTHFWHGLMGYTPNGIRCVGEEPCNSVLLYNLGCNGVGILPSVYGSYRITQIIKGVRLGPSIFDPADQRCILPGERSREDVVGTGEWFERHILWGFVSYIVFMSILVVVLNWMS